MAEPNSANPYRSPDGPLRVRPRKSADFGKRVAARWLAVLGVLGCLGLVYFLHPIYKGPQFTPWRAVFPALALGWAMFGLFWTGSALRRYPKWHDGLKDPGLLWLIIWRRIFGFSASPNYPNPLGTLPRARMPTGLQAAGFAFMGFWRGLWRTRRLRNTALGLVVKGFFGPLMVGFFCGHWQTVANLWLARKNVQALPLLAPGADWPATKAYIATVTTTLLSLTPTYTDFVGLFAGGEHLLPNCQFWLDLSYNFVFIVDCGFALVGYLFESRRFGNKTRSVESTGFGWAVAIFCYPPFNPVTGTYLPFADGAELHRTEWVQAILLHNPASFLSILQSPWFVLAIRAITVGFFIIYAAATVSFGAKFSNLTNRGIISSGPYRFIRHPAYTTKCIAWWFEHLNNMTGQTAIALVALCSLYALRAWTEERHLLQDPDYVAYKKKVRWAAIPGLF
jgi:protein-S-isoprenylcysteine O-methyltransferase Ste14